MLKKIKPGTLKNEHPILTKSGKIHMTGCSKALQPLRYFVKLVHFHLQYPTDCNKAT